MVIEQDENAASALDIYNHLMADEMQRSDDGAAFDRHVLASVLAVCTAEVTTGEAPSLSVACGLAPDALSDLVAERFPKTGHVLISATSGKEFEADEEDLLLTGLLSGFAARPLSKLIATMVARRAMQNNHLWQDLGLCNRAELSRLLFRHFPALAAGNSGNMKWKKYFYRALCEVEGSVLCTAPTCRQCVDFADCFGSEDGESQMARIRNGYGLTSSDC